MLQQQPQQPSIIFTLFPILSTPNPPTAEAIELAMPFGNGTMKTAGAEFLCALGAQTSIWPSCLSLSEAFVNVAFMLVVMLVRIFF